MAIRCVGGLEAVEYFESLPVPQGKEELREYALNRIKYEVAKGIGVERRVVKGIKAWHSDTYVCGKCGSGLGEAWHNYCPNCGTAILNNPYTIRKLKEKKEENHQIDIEEWLKRGDAE